MIPQEDLSFGFDLGIGSLGWGVLRAPAADQVDGDILRLGSYCFDVPETAKERTPTNQIRRANRLARRTIRRRAQRKRDVRALCRQYGLLDDISPEDLNRKQINPWELRAAGLKRPLTGEELAVVLLHIAIHRGFKSNSKRDNRANKADDSSKMLTAIDKNREKLSQYETVGEMLATDPEFAHRKRNRDGDFDCSVLRDDQVDEIKELFSRQRRFGNLQAAEDLQAAYIDTAFFQRPIKDSEEMVGDCPLLDGQKRAALMAPSFERFRLLTRLANLRIALGRDERKLTPAEINAAEQGLGEQKGITFKRLRRILDLPDAARFASVKPEEEGRDVVARSGAAMPGSTILRNVLRDAAGATGWARLLAEGEILDQIAFILSFRDDKDSIRQGLAELALPEELLAALTAGVEAGAFNDFRKAANLSAAACRSLIPHLRQGLDYTDACKALGWDHARQRLVKLEDIKNPIARKAVTEALKQARALVREYGLPGRMHVEMARDVGKSVEERSEIKTGLDKRTAAKEKLRDEFKENLGFSPNGEDLLRYELWKEQNGRCLYTDKEIHISHVAASNNLVQVDHILPWSRFGDDSFINKTLCFAHANQQKKGRTPFEWLKDDEKAWDSFLARVEAIKSMKGRKKRNYLLKDAESRENNFRERNLNDTRYACKMLLALLKQAFYPPESRDSEEKAVVRVAARPGQLTDILRRGWGVQGLKKTLSGDRKSDDRHHGLDAAIVGACSQSALQRLTMACQEAERRGLPRDFGHIPPPWPGFVDQLRQAFEQIFVVRAERRRARGEGHAATIRQVQQVDGADVIYERKSVDKLTDRDLPLIKDADRNHRLVESLRQWIAEGKPKDRRPLSPKGDPITKVRVTTDKKIGVKVRGGAADRGDMVRVDVFRKAKPRGGWEWFLVPVYPHQVMNEKDWPQPPNRAIQANKPEDVWPIMSNDHEFIFSLHPFSYVEIIKPNGEVISGYYRTTDRSTSAIEVSATNDKQSVTRGIGARTLKSIRKFHVDRMGQMHEIEQEQRTWHGVVCT